MRLYSGLSTDFIQATARNQIAERLRDAFFSYYRYQPSPAEVNSWRNSLRAMKDVIDGADLHDHGILLEYQLPLSSRRIDCMICGKDESQADQAVIVELKQWEKCKPADPEKVVLSWVGGKEREILHPSVQVGQYSQYLEDTHTAFHEGPSPILLSACSYLHNYVVRAGDPIIAAKFSETISKYPLFDADASDSLGGFLQERLLGGNGLPVLQRVEQSRYRTSRKLMDYVSQTIRSHAPWVLLDEQLVIYEHIRSIARKGLKDRQKHVIIVRGGPGTGKSVLAINLMSDLLREDINAHYATGSRAFTETLWEIVGSRSRATFKYFNSYGRAEPNAVDVLICDESHRIRETSNNRYTKKTMRVDTPQLHELFKASKVSVFFIDDRQIVRPNEIGSTEYIRDQAEQMGATVSEFELEIQFRCAGSDGFVNWVDNTLGIRRTANVIWEGDDKFEFQIVGSAQELDALIRARANDGHTARVAAGFCWKWSPPREDGTLVDDVVIGGYRRPWDAKPGYSKLAPGIPTASLWATDPAGIDQVGCVYNIQGFELDYVGVIWGPDLRHDPDGNEWIGDKSHSADNVVKRSKEAFVDLVKNTYRVLLSRGMKGCYVYFMDKQTERFVRSRIDVRALEKAHAQEPPLRSSARVFYPLIVQPAHKDRYVNCAPLIPLDVAAGAFGDPQTTSDGDHEWVALNTRHKLKKGMFVARVVGRSMQPLIPDGAYCLFKSPVTGTRQGKIVVVQLRDALDAETNQRYTLKRYESTKAGSNDSWEHETIVLRPINNEFEPITLTPADPSEFQVIAEFIEVLSDSNNISVNDEAQRGLA